jgi:hypothetical protein
MSKTGTYDHLNETGKLVIEIDIPELAKMVDRMNYGTHRFLSALIPILRERNEKMNEIMRKDYPDYEQPCLLADGIQALLDNDLF